MARRRGDRQLATLTQQWLATQRSPHTRAAYALDFARFVAWCAGAGVVPLRATTADVAAYARAAASRGDAGAATMARRVSVVSSFFTFAVAADAIGANPALAVARPDVQRVSQTPTLTPAQARALLEAADRQDPRAVSLVCLLVLDGLKLSEALAIDVTDLVGDPPAVRLELPGRGVAITLHRRTARAVAAQRQARRAGPLLTTASSAHRGARLTRFGADHLLKRLGVAAGLDVPVSANALRRSLVTHALDAGRSLDAIQHQLGHRDPRTTRRLALRPERTGPIAGTGSATGP